MSSKAISKALDRLEQAWLEICDADIQIGPAEFVRRMETRCKRLGLNYSQEWMDNAARLLLDQELDKRTRNLILAECKPGEIRKSGQRFDRALVKLLGLAEFASDDLRSFVSDRRKDELLRRFVWFRLFVPAEAHREAVLSEQAGREIGLNDFMPRVVVERVPVI